MRYVGMPAPRNSLTRAQMDERKRRTDFDTVSAVARTISR